jgi:hypothetical protein
MCLGRTAMPDDYGPRQKFLAEMAANDALLKDKPARPAGAKLAWAR